MNVPQEIDDYEESEATSIYSKSLQEQSSLVESKETKTKPKVSFDATPKIDSLKTPEESIQSFVNNLVR